MESPIIVAYNSIPPLPQDGKEIRPFLCDKMSVRSCIIVSLAFFSIICIYVTHLVKQYQMSINDRKI